MLHGKLIRVRSVTFCHNVLTVVLIYGVSTRHPDRFSRLIKPNLLPAFLLDLSTASSAVRQVKRITLSSSLSQNKLFILGYTGRSLNNNIISEHMTQAIPPIYQGEQTCVDTHHEL